MLAPSLRPKCFHLLSPSAFSTPHARVRNLEFRQVEESAEKIKGLLESKLNEFKKEEGAGFSLYAAPDGAVTAAAAAAAKVASTGQSKDVPIETVKKVPEKKNTQSSSL